MDHSKVYIYYEFKTNTLKNYHINTSSMSEQKCMQNVNINLYT